MRFLSLCLFVLSCSNEGSNPSDFELSTSLQEAYQIALQNVSAPNTAINNPYQTAWDIMLTMIWPAKAGERGVPDLTQVPAQDQIAVLSTWKNTAEVYLANGAEPELKWNSPSPESLAGVDEVLTVNTPLQLMQSSLAAIGVDNEIRDTHGNPLYFAVRMNQDAFNTVIRNRVYNTEGLLAFYNTYNPQGNYLTADSGAIEIKMAWKILYPGEDDFSRFYTRTANIDIPGPNGQKISNVTVGLTGMHVMSKIVPNWLFMTWEQKDNIKTTNLTKLGISPLPIPASMAAINQKMQALLAKSNSPWQYYNCMGVESQDFTNKTGVPTRLGNSQIETQLLPTASCIACHAYAGVGLTPQKKKPFLYFPGSGISQAGNLIGRAGAPDPADIFLSYQYPLLPSPKTATYMQTDFMWSIGFEGQAINPADALNLACPKQWQGPIGKDTCFPVEQLDN